MTDTQWLQNVQAGEEVVLRSGWGYAEYRIARVQRVTPTQVIVNGHKFRKQDGRCLGEPSYSRTVLMSPTAEIREKVARETAIAVLSGTNWKRYSTPTLLEFAAIKAKADAALREEGSDHP